MKKQVFASLVAGLFMLGMVGMANAVPMDIYAYNHSSISGTSNGLNTGITLTPGDLLSISVAIDDLWSAGSGPRTSNANGLNGSSPYGGYNYGLLTADGSSFYFGSLVGRIGTGNRFFVGTDYSGIANDAGNLYLMYWDSITSDNSGYVTANVDVNAPIPEPSTILLLGSGLLGFVAYRKKIKKN